MYVFTVVSISRGKLSGPSGDFFYLSSNSSGRIFAVQEFCQGTWWRILSGTALQAEMGSILNDVTGIFH
jgi:hypothetical protein